MPLHPVNTYRFTFPTSTVDLQATSIYDALKRTITLDSTPWDYHSLETGRDWLVNYSRFGVDTMVRVTRIDYL